MLESYYYNRGEIIFKCPENCMMIMCYDPDCWRQCCDYFEGRNDLEIHLDGFNHSMPRGVGVKSYSSISTMLVVLSIEEKTLAMLRFSCDGFKVLDEWSQDSAPGRLYTQYITGNKVNILNSFKKWIDLV